MKKILILIYFLIQLSVFADIEYGFNAQGKYVPMSINGEDVKYGFNAIGKYVPISIGEQDVKYSYNSFGEYVPISIGNDDIDYGFNAIGNFVPVSIGKDKINYDYNAQGKYVPMSIGDTNIQYDYNAQGKYVPVKTSIKKKDTIGIYTKNEFDIVDEELKKFFKFEVEADKLHPCTKILIENMLLFCEEHKLAKPKSYKEATYIIRVMSMTFSEQYKK